MCVRVQRRWTVTASHTCHGILLARARCDIRMPTGSSGRDAYSSMRITRDSATTPS